MKKCSLALISLIGFLALNAQDLKTGLALDMPLRGNTKDYSGNQNHGIAQNAKPTMNRFGEHQGAYYFDGNSLIKIADSQSLHFDKTITISLWANVFNSKYRGMRLVDKVDAGKNEGLTFDTFTQNGRGLRSCIGWTCVESSESYSLQNWHHMAMVFEKGNVQFYIDGIDAGKSYTRYDSIGANTLPLLLGMSQGELARSEFFTGKMSDVKIYNRALNQQEIEALRDDKILYFPQEKVEPVFPYDILKEIKSETQDPAVFSIEHKGLMMFYVNDETLSLYDTRTWNKIKTVLSPDIHSIFRLDQSYMIEDCMYIGLDRDGVVDGYLCLDLNTLEENPIDCDSSEKDCRDNNKSIAFLQTEEAIELNGFSVFQKDSYLITKVNQEKLTFNNSLDAPIDEKVAFIAMYPQSQHIGAMEASIFNNCSTVTSLADLADRHPQYAKRAEKRAYDGIKDGNTVMLYGEFIARFPKSIYLKEIQKLKANQEKINATRISGRDTEMESLLPREDLRSTRISVADIKAN